MTIIADSGSTKTTWMEVESGNKIVTEGLNSHFTTDEAFLAACDIVRKEFSISNLQFSIYFYGAGCGSAEQANRTNALLQKAFGTESVQVETDMLGACRAVCGDDAGLVGILGTGSNACYYDGEKILYQAPSLGYVIGDHGSANYVGRKLLENYLSGTMPNDLLTRFHEDYPFTHEEFIDAIYHKPNANRFLASVAPFALKYSQYPFLSGIIRHSIQDWLHHQLLSLTIKSNCKDLYIVGGFAKAMESIIREYVGEKYNIVQIVADPIDGLRKYHLKHNKP